VTAWEEGLEGGAEDEAVKLVLIAIHQLLQRMVSALLMSRNGYKMQDNRIPHSIGSPVPNPWLLNTQRKLKPSDPWLHEVSECAQQQEGSFVGDVDPLVPLAPLPLVDVEQKALLETACALDYHPDSHHQCDKAKRPISLFDLLKVLREQKSLIPSHSVYAINMERLYTKLYHQGHDD
jgi:transcriptional adapter 1